MPSAAGTSLATAQSSRTERPESLDLPVDLSHARAREPLPPGDPRVLSPVDTVSPGGPRMGDAFVETV
jgi:hypothetical protein